MPRGALITLLAALALAQTGCAGRDQGAARSGRNATAERLYAEGKRHLQEGRPAQAVDSLRAARRADPASVDVLNALGAAYDMIGRFDLAGQTYRVALLIAPRDPATLNNMGWSNHLRGRAELARAYLQRARSVLQDDPVIERNIALAAEPPASGAAPQPARTVPARSVWIEQVGTRTHTLRFAADGPASAAPAPSPPPGAEAGLPRPAAVRLEISNGTGRAGMARRFAGWLDGPEGRRPRLTNAAHYRHATTAIRYTGDAAAAAGRLAARLPVAAGLQRVAGPGAQIQIVLGADLLEFDGRLQPLAQAPDKQGRG